jgi:Tryptophan-associated transmembrane protein (Trp_oprn_chp)
MTGQPPNGDNRRSGNRLSDDGLSDDRLSDDRFAKAEPADVASSGAGSAEAGSADADGARERGSLGLALIFLAVGAAAVIFGAGRAWATVHATSQVPQLGVDWTATAGVTGNDVVPLSALALMAVVFALGIAVTRGRGRWPVGVGLFIFGLAVIALTLNGADQLRETAFHLAVAGRLEGLPAGAELRVDTSPIGASLAVAGGLLVAAAGVLTVWHGRSWPVLGDRYNVPAGGARPAAGAVHHDDAS